MAQLSNLLSCLMAGYLQRLSISLSFVNPLDPLSQYFFRAVTMLCSLIQINALFFFAEPKNEDNWVLINGLMMILILLISLGSFSL